MVALKQNKIQQKKITNFNENNEMEMNLETLHAERKIWRDHNRNAICWAFHCVNDDREVHLENSQVMRCLLNLFQ
jgi:hypothetical protein